ncbi:MAG: transcriptional regulator [Aestuariivita sp.]|nr:transcriptional regulator [Aestuariivita sp.]
MKNSIKHHVSDDLMMAYASGNLPEAFSVAVAAHISMCDECRTAMESYDAIGGALLENQTNIGVGPDSLQRTLDKIAATEPVKKGSRPVNSNVPAPLSDYVGFNLDSIDWQPIGMGVKQSILETSSEATARLLYIPPGTAMPDHSHSGIEMTLVLKGAFADESEYFAEGDVEIADGSTNHTPVAADGSPCICLAVTEAPLKFRRFFHRVFQPLMRI